MCFSVLLQGHKAAPITLEVQIFTCSNEEAKRQNWPDLQIILQGRLWNTKHLRNFLYTDEVRPQMQKVF
jgi:hypothetical protein